MSNKLTEFLKRNRLGHIIALLFAMLIIAGLMIYFEFENPKSCAKALYKTAYNTMVQQKTVDEKGCILEGLDKPLGTSPTYTSSVIPGFVELHPPEGTVFAPEGGCGPSEGPALVVGWDACLKRTNDPDCIRQPQIFEVGGKIVHPVFRGREMAMLIGDQLEQFYDLVTRAQAFDGWISYNARTAMEESIILESKTGESEKIKYNKTYMYDSFKLADYLGEKGYLSSNLSEPALQENNTFGNSFNYTDKACERFGNRIRCWGKGEFCVFYNGKTECWEEAKLVPALGIIEVRTTISNMSPGRMENNTGIVIYDGSEKISLPGTYDYVGDMFVWNGTLAFIANKKVNWRLYTAKKLANGYIVEPETSEFFDLRAVDTPENFNRQYPVLYGHPNLGKGYTEGGIIAYPLFEAWAQRGPSTNITEVKIKVITKDLVVHTARVKDKTDKYFKTRLYFNGQRVGNAYDNINDAGMHDGQIWYKGTKNDSQYVIYDAKVYGPFDYDSVKIAKTVNSSFTFIAKRDGKPVIVQNGNELSQNYQHVTIPVEINGKLTFFALKFDSCAFFTTNDEWVIVTEK